MNFISLIEQVLCEGKAMDVVNSFLKKGVDLTTDTPRPETTPTNTTEYPYLVVRNNKLAYIDLNGYGGLGFTAYIPKEYFSGTRTKDYVGVFAFDKFFDAFDTLVKKLEALPRLELPKPLKKRNRSNLKILDLTKNTPRPTQDELLELEKSIKGGKRFVYVYNGSVASIARQIKQDGRIYFQADRMGVQGLTRREKAIAVRTNLSDLLNVVERMFSGEHIEDKFTYIDIIKRPSYMEIKKIEEDAKQKHRQKSNTLYRYIFNGLICTFYINGNMIQARCTSKDGTEKVKVVVAATLPELFDRIEEHAFKGTTREERIARFVQSLHED